MTTLHLAPAVPPRIVRERFPDGTAPATGPDMPPSVGDDLPPKPPSWLPTPGHTPAYLRTTGQMLSAMRELEAKYPTLVKLVDVGDSANKVGGRGGSDIWMLELTNQRTDRFRKPTATHIGGIHAREIANPELLLGWGTALLEKYGTDAEATALLDTRVIQLLPVVNPDGHDVVTKGFADGANGHIWQRKNTAEPGQVDLNRNFRWEWGATGTSRDPRSDVYRGPGAASEPETQAIQRVLEEQRPDIFLDWHSFSGLNLYPWGDSFLRTRDDARLEAVAKQFSRRNGYVAQRSVELYPTSGTSIDHAYGVHRIPSFAVETGDQFHPLEPEFADIRRRNEPVLDYVARIADDPYERAQGPEVRDLRLAPDGTISAATSDAATGANTIRAAEWTIDPLRQLPGRGTPLAAADGAFDGADELLSGRFELPPTKPGHRPVTPKLLYVRAQDVEGNWGPATPHWLTPPPAGVSAGR